jgi:hypothetical protein
MRILWLLVCFTFTICFAQLPSISSKVENATKLDGFIPMYHANGKIWLEVKDLDREFLYVPSLRAGLGSNDIGLDRGQLGQERVVRFQRFGPKLMLVQGNLDYRAVSDDPAERRAVEESFAQSVIAGFDIAAETDGRLLIDATTFFLRDAHGVSNSLKRSRQGDYRLDLNRSAISLDRTKNFPKNTEVEVMLTFAGDNPGNYVRDVVPQPESITVRQHHSFVQLPEPGYQSRLFNPNSGYFPISYADYATPIDQPLVKRFITRHRLEKQDRNAALSLPVKPIVYYLDRGAPEPVRSALLDGARWWNQAFEAAGYKDAFRVELLPEDADPMDLRYNVIQWVHRSTRGWSYGASVTDPRTGEIIKGHVTLGSLRVRQDYLIAEGLLSPYKDGKSMSPEMQQMAIARLRQLSAHEVGHTLGLAHNYIASSRSRASVMDYPGPFAKLNDQGGVTLNDAYAVGIGDWDRISIRYGYAELPSGAPESEALEAILQEGRRQDLVFLSDQDGRPEGSSHPQTHLWDNGNDAAVELDRVMKVRQVALSKFGENVIQNGRPMATLEEALVPLYLGHRYQVEAASKVVGGLSYRYALRGDGQPVTEAISWDAQTKALKSLMATLTPEALVLPERITKLIPPRPMGFPRTRESFPSRTGLTFDTAAPGEVAGNLTIGMLLHPERATRLSTINISRPGVNGLRSVTTTLIKQVTESGWLAAAHQPVGHRLQHVLAVKLMELFRSEQASSSARADAMEGLKEYKQQLLILPNSNERMLAMMIDQFLAAPKEFAIPKIPDAPPGQPIGCEE